MIIVMFIISQYWLDDYYYQYWLAPTKASAAPPESVSPLSTAVMVSVIAGLIVIIIIININIFKTLESSSK